MIRGDTPSLHVGILHDNFTTNLILKLEYISVIFHNMGPMFYTHCATGPQYKLAQGSSPAEPGPFPSWLEPSLGFYRWDLSKFMGRLRNSGKMYGLGEFRFRVRFGI